MNNFKVHKIRTRSPHKPLNEKTKQNIITGLGIILLLLVLYYGGLKALDALSGLRFINVISGVLGKELAMDEKGKTNILVLGVGGEGHEGKDLTDTILLASIDHKNPSVSLLSIPRDLYLESSLGGSRINRLYEKGKMKWGSALSLDFVRTTVEDVIKVPIHYFIKVDFEAFEKVVDSLDGIEVYVEKTIDDPEYPNEATFGFELFHLDQGTQHLDGKTALKYVRSRKSSSDFDRSKRQQQVLLALKDKAQGKNIFARKNFIKQLYYSLEEHVETNLSLREMLSFIEFGSQWNSQNLISATLNDEPIFEGGFLYTPLRELYGGAFVLLPASDNFESIRFFIQLIFYGPKEYNKIPLIVLNGTEEIGLAATVRKILHRFNINVVSVGNAETKKVTETKWYVLSPHAQPLAEFLQTMFPGKIAINAPLAYQEKSAEGALILELGTDAVPIIEKLDIFRNVVELKPKDGTQAATSGASIIKSIEN